MKDPHFHPLGVFNISMFNGSDSDTRLRASISLRPQKNEGFRCPVWNEQVLKSGRKVCVMKRVDIFCRWGRVLWTVDGSGTGSAVCQAADCGCGSWCKVCAFRSFEESSMSPACTPSIFPMPFHNFHNCWSCWLVLNHLELIKSGRWCHSYKWCIILWQSVLIAGVIWSWRM